MKRFIIVLFIIAGVIAFSLFSLYRIRSIKEEMTNSLSEMEQLLDAEDYDGLNQMVKDFTIQWVKQESILVHYVRHGQIHDISNSVATLQTMAEHKMGRELYIEFSRIHWKILHLWNSEIPVLDNIL
ncbi:DUF4363 family protein [Oscillospiraceae bacterium MB08-C2-2]|nr:DUF4363 family protein [Oscillospiraceae bacterium MB08-C2-2]